MGKIKLFMRINCVAWSGSFILLLINKTEMDAMIPAAPNRVYLFPVRNCLLFFFCFNIINARNMPQKNYLPLKAWKFTGLRIRKRELFHSHWVDALLLMLQWFSIKWESRCGRGIIVANLWWTVLVLKGVSVRHSDYIMTKTILINWSKGCWKPKKC